MKIAILTCGNAQEYLEANIFPCLKGMEMETVKHKRELEEDHYDIILLACDDAGVRASSYGIIRLDDGTPVADLTVLDQEESRKGASLEKIKEKIAMAVLSYLLQAKRIDEVFLSLVKLSLSGQT